MSLLSGIKFIPKSKIKQEQQDNEHSREEKRKNHHLSHSSKKRTKTSTKVSSEDYDIKDVMNKLSDEDINSLKEDFYDERSNNNFKTLLSAASNDKYKIDSNVDSDKMIQSADYLNTDPTNKNAEAAAILRNKLRITKGSLDSDIIRSSQTSNKLYTSHLETSNNHKRHLRSINDVDDGYDDVDLNMQNNILRLGDKYVNKLKPTAGSRTGIDEEEDDGMDIYKSNTTQEAQQKKQIMNAVRHDDKLKKIMASCKSCIGNVMSNKYSYYNIAIGQYCYLRLKVGGFRLQDCHCEIIPMNHVCSFRSCEEQAVAEIIRFKSCVKRVFCDALGLSTVFAESAVDFNKLSHSVIDCIPIENGLEVDVVLTFRESLQNSGKEWSQHQKIIELKHGKGIHRALPPNFEYLHIELASIQDKESQGLVHVVENNQSIDEYFCLDVISGVLEDDPIRIRSKMPIDLKYEYKLVDRFKEIWKQCEWTKYLVNTVN